MQYYKQIAFKRDKKKDGWTRPFNAEDYRGSKLLRDLVDAKTGEVVAPAGRKLTKRGAKKLADDGLKNVLISNEEMSERFAAEDIVNMETGQIYAEAGDELSEEAQVSRRQLRRLKTCLTLSSLIVSVMIFPPLAVLR